MDDVEKGRPVRNFFKIEAATLAERYRIIETLMPNARTKGAAHRGEEGRHIESLLRDFLNRHLPRNLKAVSGFILCPSTKTSVQNLDRVMTQPDRHSSQLDIIIYDFDSYPVFESFEEFCVVPPEGVIGIISVKKTLYNADIENEVAALKAAAELCRHAGRRGPFTALVAFGAEDDDHDSLGRRIFAAIERVHNESLFDPMVNEVSILERICAFKNRPEHGRDNSAKYVGIDCRDETHIPLQRLIQSTLSVFYDKSRMRDKERPGFVSFRKATFANSPELGLVRFCDQEASEPRR